MSVRMREILSLKREVADEAGDVEGVSLLSL